MSLVIALALMQTVPPAPTQDIVVRGKRTAAALAACIERRCPTTDDVRLSIAHAESQFAEGRYREARATLDRAIDRNRAAVARFPRHVAALHEARATVVLHDGDMDAYKQSVGHQARALRSNLPDDDPQVLLTAIQLGDGWLKRGFVYDAERQYRFAQRGFEARGEHRLAAFAALRSADIHVTQKRAAAAKAILAKVATGPAARDPAVATMSAVMATRLDLARDDDASVERLLATLRTDPAVPPVLIEEPEIQSALLPPESPAQRFAESSLTQPRAGSSTPVRWADIGFMVTPEGKVKDVEVLRGSRMQAPMQAPMQAWSAPFVTQVAGRRYAPLALPQGHPGMYRVERVTLRAERVVPIGSLIKRPAGRMAVERLDLTRAEAAVAAPPG